MKYICSTLRENATHTMEENIAQAKAICRHSSLKGELVMAVHLYFTQFLDDLVEEERKCGMKHGLSMLKLCDEVWVFGEIISRGMQAEIELAEQLCKPVRYIADIEAWLKE